MSGLVCANWSAVEQELVHTTQRALLFQVSGSTYAISVDFVSKVIETGDVTSVPGAPPWVAGALVYEFLVYPLLDLSKLLQTELLNQEKAPDSKRLQRAIASKSAHGHVLLGVEQVVTIAELSRHARVDISRPEFPAAYIDFICRVEDRHIGVVSIPRLLRAAAAGVARSDSSGQAR